MNKTPQAFREKIYNQTVARSDAVCILGTQLALHNGTPWAYDDQNKPWIREAAKGRDYNCETETNAPLLPDKILAEAFAHAAAIMSRDTGTAVQPPTAADRARILRDLGL